MWSVNDFSLDNSIGLDNSISCDRDALEVGGRQMVIIVPGAMLLWAAPLLILSPPLTALAQGQKLGLHLTDLSSCHHQHTRV